MKNQVNRIINHVFEKYNKDVSVFDESFLEKTIGARMTGTSISSMGKYCELLANSPDEALALLDSLTNAYSEFFRNPLTFAMLEQFVIPKLATGHNPENPSEIRIWSAGCAAGQEPYSLAMLTHHYKTSHPANSRFRIFATDVSEKQLQTAQQGIYDGKMLQNTRMAFVNDYFTKTENTYKVDDRIKSQVGFSVYDLLQQGSSAPPASIFGDFDLIMCSNVLFYYHPETRKMILSKFYRSLKQGGFFVTGEAEISIVKNCTEFKQYAAPTAIFIKN